MRVVYRVPWTHLIVHQTAYAHGKGQQAMGTRFEKQSNYRSAVFIARPRTDFQTGNPALRRSAAHPQCGPVLGTDLGWWRLLRLDDERSDPTGLGGARWLLWPIFALAVMLVGFYTFALVANFIAAPFNGMLAEAVERYLTGQSLRVIPRSKASQRRCHLSSQNFESSPTSCPE